MNMKEELKTVSFGTLKINYFDFRIMFFWCKCYEVLLNVVFIKVLIDKFYWVMDCEMEFSFV